MSKLKAAIYGLAVGDALGVPFEFKPRGSFDATGMVGHGTHNQAAGTWSDDTSMVLATCHSIKKNDGKIDIEDIRSHFENWLHEGEYTPHGRVFDCGITTAEAINAGKGHDDLYSNGNGALMRILPLAFTDCDEEDVNAVSAITHAHEISTEGCRIYVNIARSLLEGKSIGGILANLQVSDVYSRLKVLNDLDESQISSTGYVVDTLEASLWCLIKTDNYKGAVLKAINLGDDTDTVGAVAGGLAGIMYGYDEIPQEWREALQNRRLIDDCLF